MSRSTPPHIRPAVPYIGWREWVALPELGVAAVKVKIDTGARSSALHAFDIEPFQQHGKEWVRFTVQPLQRNAKQRVQAEAEVLDVRSVRNSGGQSEHRWVIQTPVVMGEHRWPIELTLTNRDQMGFRMLLGRQAVRRRFMIDCGHSFLWGRPPLAIRRPA